MSSSRYIITHLFDSGAPALHGLIPVDGLLLPLLLTVVAAATPYAAAQTSSEYSSDSNFDPSTAITIVVLVSAFFFLGFFSIYVGQCIEDNADGNSRFSVATRSRLSVRGLDPAVIDSFPIFNYAAVKDLKIGNGALECAVCINEFDDNETLRLLPKCDHVFHPECIDAWLASHSTCPVCRANLTPTSSELTESNDSTEERESSSELSEVQNHNQISINVDEEQNRDPQVSDIPKQNRQRMTKLPRSHSTGHSLVQPGENCERYTLRLPEEVRKQILKHRLKRTKSCIVLFPTEGSSRRGYRNGGEGSNRGRQVGRSHQFGRSDRWIFTKTPPFCSRTSPVMSPKIGADGDVTAAVGTSELFLTSVKTPFDCPAIKGEQMSTRLPV